LTGEVAKNKVVGEGKNKQVTRPAQSRGVHQDVLVD
jgi:hypothetical protein